MIIDTDILIDASRRVSDAINFMSTASPLSISAVTHMELTIGCRNKAEQAALARFLARYSILPVTTQISDIAQRLITEYYLSHGLLIPDAFIAATALTLDEQLVTKNQRDFRFIADLDLVPYP